jgi:hypothetical protein
MKNNINAFPSFELDVNKTVVQEKNVIYDIQKGMTLLDYFANSAMQGLLSTCHGSSAGVEMIKNHETLAKRSYVLAASMLKERINYEK